MIIDNSSDPTIETLLEFLKSSRGFDFTGYKRPSLTRRINKRMQMLDIHRYSQYIDYLNVHPDEFTELFNTILINVTSFFRDSSTWEYIAKKVIPDILSDPKADGFIRVWSVGCATGEETYSVAMLFAEAIGLDNFSSKVKIYASDLDDEELNKARTAIYSTKAVEGVPASLLEKYFEKSGDAYAVHKELRRSVIFGKHDVIHDAPISHIDLLICRNLLMYFNTETQARVLARLHFAIKDGGFLVLGRAETLLAHSSLFAPIEFKARVFRSANQSSIRDRLQTMAINGTDESTKQLASQFQIREAAFKVSPVSQIVVDLDGALTLANDRARQMFVLTARDIGQPFQDLELSYKPAELRSAIEKAHQDQGDIVLSKIVWVRSSREKTYLDITVSPLPANGYGSIAFLISFIDITAQVRLHEKLEQLNVELETAMAELQSTNEELETTNEELQSSNEEMETMNEELQSINEELETINEESRSLGEEFNQVNQLFEAIVTSLQGGIIVTDQELRILAWNHKSEDLWGLRFEEVHGKFLFNLDIGLPVLALRPFIKSVMKSENDCVDTTVQARNRRGKEIECNITVLPLLLKDKGIQGSILVVEDSQS